MYKIYKNVKKNKKQKKKGTLILINDLTISSVDILFYFLSLKNNSDGSSVKRTAMVTVGGCWKVLEGLVHRSVLYGEETHTLADSDL